MEILFADDDEDIRIVVGMVLSQRGYDVTCVEDGAGVLEHIARGARPGLLVLDMMMPRLDGEGVVRALRIDPSTATIPVLFITGSIAARERARQLGAACLVKPVDLELLLSTIARYVPTAPDAAGASI
jgi:CheY-like chemotaxis protein